MLAYARYVSLVLFLFLFLDTCNAWRDEDKDKTLLLDLCNDLVVDLSRKGETVWTYRKIFAQYVSFAVGERVYIIRARFAAMLRSYLRNIMYRKKYEVKQLVRNTLLLQKRTQGIYILNNELIDFDRQISTVDNPYNVSRFHVHDCNVAGPPCDIIPIREGYRRNWGAMDEALKLIDERRRFIKQTYQPNKKLLPIDIGAEVKRSLSFKYTTLSTPKNQDIKTVFVNLAPDVMN